MLETSRGCAAQHKQVCSQYAAWRWPAGAPADRNDGRPACQQVAKNNQVECPHARSRIERGPGNEQRRKNQRLRIRHAGMSAIMVGIPERPVSGMEGGG